MESPITGQKNHDIKAGHRWEGMFVYPPMKEVTAREWKAWFATMYGPAKTFYCFDPDIRTPEGVADTGSSTPLVKGASQTGISITSDGWALDTVNLLLPGDHVQIGGELKIVTEIVTSVSDDATINFQPALHVSPNNNSAIVFENPKGIFKLEGDSVSWDSNQFGIHEFAISFYESF